MSRPPVYSYPDEVARQWKAERDAAMVALTAIKACVDEQAEDEGLWSVPVEGLQRIAEAHLQQELRSLHRVIEEAVDAVLEVTPNVLSPNDGGDRPTESDK